MSSSYTLHQGIISRFRETLGNPDKSLGRDAHWSIKPAPYRPAINILVDTNQAHPEVWVFDPNNDEDGITRMTIEDLDQVMEVISLVKQRLQQAQQKAQPE